MKLRHYATLAVSLIGLYAIFSALLLAGLPVVAAVVTFFTGGWEALAYTCVMIIPQFIVPIVGGVLLVRKAAVLGSWLCRGIPAEGVEGSGGPTLKAISPILFSLLGLYMLSQTVPNGLKTVALWFQARAAETQSYLGISTASFWHDQFGTIVYHLSAIGFSLFVFLWASGVSRFVWSLRTGGTQAYRKNAKDVQPGATDNPDGAS